MEIRMSVEEIIAMLEKRMGIDILKDETMAAPKSVLNMFTNAAEKLDIERTHKVGDLVKPDRALSKMASHTFKDEDIILKIIKVRNDLQFQEICVIPVNSNDKRRAYAKSFEFVPATFADGMRLLHDHESTFVELVGISPYSLQRIYDVAARKTERYENIFNDNGVKYTSVFDTITDVWFNLEKDIRKYIDFDHFVDYTCKAIIRQTYSSLDEFLENWLILINLAKQVNRPVNLYCKNIDLAIRILKRELNKKNI